MGFLEGVRTRIAEKRTIAGVPWQPWLDPYLRWDVGGPTHPSKSRYGVDEALGLPALYAGSKILSDNAASLPLRVYTQGGKSGPRLVPYSGPTMFDDPTVLGTPFDWIFACMSSLILQGNAWGLITGRDGFGFPKGIEWVPAERVYVEEDPDQPFNPVRTKVFVYGREMRWQGAMKEIYHIKAFSLPGRLDGISLLRNHALTITAGQEAQRYGTDWYKAGGFPPGTFQNSEAEVTPEQSEMIRAQLVKTLRRREPLVYGRNWDYTPVTVPPSEAQFIDAMRMTATHIAALLDLPPSRVGGDQGSLTYSTVEQNQLQVIEALRPWLCRLEQSFSRLLPNNRVVRFNTDALLKTDLKTRAEIITAYRNIGLQTVDELRDLIDLPPLPNDVGNETMPLQLMTSMAQRAGAFPKNMQDQVIFLMDRAGDKLQEMEKQGLTTASKIGGVDPKTGEKTGPAHNAGDFFANMMNAYSRSMEDLGYVAEARMLRDWAFRNFVQPQVRTANASTAEALIDEVIDQRRDDD